MPPSLVCQLGSVTLIDAPAFKMQVAIPQQSLTKLDTLAADAAVCLYLDDSDTEHEGFKLAWRKFWAASNLFQFLPSSCAVSQSGLEDSIYGDILLASLHSSQETSAASDIPQAWQDALELTVFPEQLNELYTLGCPVPESALDWCNAEGEVMGEIEWPWLEQKVAFIHEAPEFAGMLTNAGWRVITTLTSTDIHRLANWLIEHEQGVES